MLKGKSGGESTKGGLRKILMILQFSVSIFLIIATIVIAKQLSFVLNKDLGWNTDNIIQIELKGEKFNNKESRENNKSAFLYY